nr:MAG TPA: hypothetical protein [Caudoviricetes sp.]
MISIFDRYSDIIIFLIRLGVCLAFFSTHIQLPFISYTFAL